MFKLLKITKKTVISTTENEIVLASVCFVDKIFKFKNEQLEVIDPPVEMDSLIGIFEGKEDVNYFRNSNNKIIVGMISKTEFADIYVDYAENSLIIDFDEEENDVEFLKSFYSNAELDQSIIKKMIEDYKIPVIGIVSLINLEEGETSLMSNYNNVNLPASVDTLFEDNIKAGLYPANNLRYVEDMIFLMWIVKSGFVEEIQPDTPEAE